MKLEPGMYVRTKDYSHIPSYINKIIEITDDYVKLENQKNTNYVWQKEDISKASHTLLGNDNEPCLIEVGDYVNGLRVEESKYGELYTSYVYYGGDIGKMCEVYTTWLKEYKEDEIYSIVTKEQFSQIEYEVE